MVWVLNKSERAYNLAGVMITPLVPVEIDDSFLNNARLKEIMADGDIEQTDAPSGDNKSTTNKPDESREQPNSSQPTNNDGALTSSNRYKPSASKSGN